MGAGLRSAFRLIVLLENAPGVSGAFSGLMAVFQGVRRLRFVGGLKGQSFGVWRHSPAGGTSKMDLLLLVWGKEGIPQGWKPGFIGGFEGQG